MTTCKNDFDATPNDDCAQFVEEDKILTIPGDEDLSNNETIYE